MRSIALSGGGECGGLGGGLGSGLGSDGGFFGGGGSGSGGGEGLGGGLGDGGGSGRGGGRGLGGGHSCRHCCAWPLGGGGGGSWMAGGACRTNATTAPPGIAKMQTAVPMRRQLQRPAGVFWMPISSSPIGTRSWRRAPLRGASEDMRPRSSALAISPVMKMKGAEKYMESC